MAISINHDRQTIMRVVGGYSSRKTRQGTKINREIFRKWDMNDMTELDKNRALHARRLQVLRKRLDSILKVGTINQGQATLGANTQLLESTLGVRETLILLIGIVDRSRAQRIPLQDIVLGMEEEPLGGFTALLLFLLWP